MNGLAHGAIGLAIGSVFGAGVAWGALTTSLSDHKLDDGHPTAMAKIERNTVAIGALGKEVARADERQKSIMNSLSRIEQRLGTQP